MSTLPMPAPPMQLPEPPVQRDKPGFRDPAQIYDAATITGIVARLMPIPASERDPFWTQFAAARLRERLTGRAPAHDWDPRMLRVADDLISTALSATGITGKTFLTRKHTGHRHGI